MLERKEGLRRFGKIAAFSVAGLVVIAGAVYGLSLLPKAAATVHWHANLKTFVNDQQISFTSPRFDMSQSKSRIHFHLPNDMQMHLEGPSDRLRLIDFFHSPLGGDISDSKLVLPDGSSRPGTYTANDTSQLRLFYLPLNGNWTELASGIPQHSFANGEKAALLYGNYTAEQIATIEAGIPDVANS